MRIFITLMVLVGTTLFLTADTSAGDDRGGDRGVGRVVGVATHGDQAVPGAAIVLKNRRTDRKLRTRSDREGRFNFDRVPAGTWIIIGRHDRAGSGRKEIVVHHRRTTRVHLELK